MQTMIVVLILVAAASYIGRMAWRAARSGGGKSDDGGCGSGSCH